MRIKQAVGNITVTQNGVTTTLKPGDPIPDITDPNATFTAVNGEIDLQVNGKTIKAGPGATFSVSVVNGAVNVTATGGVPVAVKTEDGHNVVLTGGSQVTMSPTTDGQVAINVVSGNALVSDSSGGESQSLGTGQTIDVSSTHVETAGETTTEGPRVVQPPPSTVTDSGIIVESGSVSGSNPK